MRGDQRGCKRSEATNSALLSGELAEILKWRRLICHRQLTYQD